MAFTSRGVHTRVHNQTCHFKNYVAHKKHIQVLIKTCNLAFVQPACEGYMYIK